MTMLSWVDQRQLPHEFLPGRSAVEGDDLAQFLDGEIARIQRRDLIDDLVHARVHAVQQQRHDGIVIALDLRPVLTIAGFSRCMMAGMRVLK